MKFKHPSPWLALLCCLLGVICVQPARAYITYPVATLGQLCGSTYVTVVKVDKVSQEKGVIVYRKVQDLKGKYPQEVIKHVFDLKNTPAHNGPGDVPIRPDEKDWKHALQWAEAGKTAVMFTLKYDPYGDFGHTYIDGCWYASMCPKRDWEFWYAIYSDPALLSRWHCGTPAQLVSGLEAMLAGKDAVLPVMVGGTKDDLRAGRAKIQGMKVSTKIHDYNPKRDLVAGWLEKTMVPSLVKSLQHPNRDQRAKAARELGLIGPEAKEAVPGLLVLLQDKEDDLRLAALTALEQIGVEAKAALPAFLTALKDPLLRRSATRGLGKLGPQAKAAVPELTALLPKTEGQDRLEIAEALVRIEPQNKAVVATLAGLLKDANVETRLRAVEILAQAGVAAKSAEPALVELLKDADAGLRIRAAELLGPSGLATREVLAATAAIFEDQKSVKETRLRAATLLGQLGAAAEPAVPALIKAMKDPDRDIRVKTAATLAQVGPAAKAAIPALAETVGNDASGTVRMHAADALLQMGPEAKSARPALKAALGDPRMAQRQEVLAKIREVYDKLK